MAYIHGFRQLVQKLENRLKEVKIGSQGAVIVGYTQSYAVYVHENLEAVHPIGQAKFLEQPARMYRRELALIVTHAMRRKATLIQALLLAGLRLQRESQKLCPVDTSALRNSAFTRVER